MTYIAHIENEGQTADHEEIMEQMMILPSDKREGVGCMDKTNYGYCGHMGGMSGKMGYDGLHLVIGVITWMAAVALLISLARYFWNKGDK